jgi:hypothetical protein
VRARAFINLSASTLFAPIKLSEVKKKSKNFYSVYDAVDFPYEEEIQ